MHTHGEIIDAFRGAMSQSGVLPPDDIEADGLLHRFSTTGKRSTNKTGYYVLHMDGVPAGTFGDWRNGLQAKWRFDKPLSKADAAAAKKLVAEKKRERAKEQAALQGKAARAARRIWDASARINPGSHPYIGRKRIGTHGTRVCADGRLIVPVFDTKEELCGLQYIDGEGEKKFLYGTPMDGGHFVIGESTQGFVGIAEGFATAASVHEVTGFKVVVAFNAGNLMSVARWAAKRFRDCNVVVFADDDWQTDGNPGFKFASAAVKAVRGMLVTIGPGSWPDGWTRGTDFNDLCKAPDGTARFRDALVSYTNWNEL